MTTVHREVTNLSLCDRRELLHTWFVFTNYWNVYICPSLPNYMLHFNTNYILSSCCLLMFHSHNTEPCRVQLCKLRQHGRNEISLSIHGPIV